MPDVLTPAQCHRCMSHIRSKMGNEPRVHKAPHHFYFDYTDAPKTIEDIIDRINTKKYDNLDDLLKSIEWELVGDDLIEPINVRHFKCIADNEINE